MLHKSKIKGLFLKLKNSYRSYLNLVFIYMGLFCFVFKKEIKFLIFLMLLF